VTAPGVLGLPVSTVEAATSAMKTSKIPPEDLMINWRPVCSPKHMKL